MDHPQDHQPVAVPLVGTSMAPGAPEVGGRDLARFGKHAPHLAAARRQPKAPLNEESYDFTPPAPAPAVPAPGMR